MSAMPHHWRRAQPAANITADVNPWIAPATPSEPAAPAPAVSETPTVPVVQPGVSVPPPGERLQRRTLSVEEAAMWLWVLGAHGGAGTTTIAGLLEAGDAGRAWPIPPDVGVRPQVLLCARISLTGLLAAQRALREWASGTVPVALHGVLLVPAGPKQPKELKDLAARVKAAASGAVWQLAWHPGWVYGQPQEGQDRQLERLAERLRKQREKGV